MTDRVNPVIFVDFPTNDPVAMAEFYAELLGWEHRGRPEGEFHEVLPGLKPNLGIHKEQEPVRGPVPRVFVMVEDPTAMLARAVELGATILWEERHWEEFGGDLAAFRDPWGSEIVLWRDKGTYVRDS